MASITPFVRNALLSVAVACVATAYGRSADDGGADPPGGPDSSDAPPAATATAPARAAFDPQVRLQVEDVQHVVELTAAEGEYCAVTMRGSWAAGTNVLYYADA